MQPFRTPPMFPQPQQPQIIDPRAEYEQQSRLAEELLARSRQYTGGGYGEALAMMLNAYNAKKTGEKAESSLSAALEQEAAQAEQEQARLVQEEIAKREAAFEDFKRQEMFKRENAPPPALIQEMLAAGIDPRSQQGQEIIARGRGTNVNVNTAQPEPGFLYGSDAGLPPGWRLDTTTQQASQIPGGPAEVEAERVQETRDNRADSVQRAGQTVLRSVTRALEITPELVQGSGVAGASARKARSLVPGTPEYNLQLQVNDFLSNVGLDALQAVRDGNPNGGGLGQVPIQQQQRLERVLGSFDIAQDPQIIEENLDAVGNIYIDIMFGSERERAQLVEEGKLSPEENARINAQYRETPFDEFGRRKEQNQQGQRPGPNAPDEELQRYYQ